MRTRERRRSDRRVSCCDRRRDGQSVIADAAPPVAGGSIELLDRVWTGDAIHEAIGVRRNLVGSRPKVETVLNESDAETGLGTVLGGMGRVKDIGEKETDELKGKRDEQVPRKAEKVADG